VFVEYSLLLTISTLYYVPSFRHKVRMLDPEPILKTAIVRYQDDENVGAVIDAMQRKVWCK